MFTKIVLSACSIAGIGLTGCASLQPREAFPGVADQVQARTGARAVWNQGGSDDQAVMQSVREMLSHDLTADAAVQIALLNNRTVQATYEELGIAQAELVQAGLLTNPVFSALVRFPGGGRGSADVELSVSQNFIELLSVPLRKKAAASQYEAAKARVAAQVVSMSFEVRKGFYMLQGAEQMLDMRRSVLQATAAFFDASKRLREAGNTTELALANDQALYGQAKLDMARAEAEAVKDRENLIALLGLWGPDATIKVAGRLPALPDHETDLTRVESLAVRRRLDLSAAVAELNATYQSLGFTQRFTWLNNAEISVDTEHDTDGSWVTGPGISIPIPIFDDGSAQVSVARARVRQASDRLYAMAVQVRSEARSAHAQMLAAREQALFYELAVLPLRRKITQQTQLQYNAMIAGVFQLLLAKRDEIDAAHGYIQSLQDYWLARTELERAVGGILPAQSPPTTAPDMDMKMPDDMNANEHHRNP